MMKPLSYSLVCTALWIAAPAGAQIGTIPSDQRALKIIQTEAPVFPFALQNTMVMQGDAIIAVDVDQKGQLTDWLVTGYSRKEFAASALEAIKHWRFEPPNVNGEPYTGTSRRATRTRAAFTL